MVTQTARAPRPKRKGTTNRLRGVQKPFSVPDLAERLQRNVRVVTALGCADLHPEELRSHFDLALWRATELDRNRLKYCIRFRSAAVLQAQEVEIRHEHVVERRWLLERMLENPPRAHRWLALAVGCVVTREEHDALSAADGWGWERYSKAGIAVVDCQGMVPLELKVAQASLLETRRLLECAD